MEEKIFRVEMMTVKNWIGFSRGERQYISEYYDVEAEDPEYALAIAEYENPEYIIVEGVEPKVVEERIYTISEKDKLLSRIAWLEDELKTARIKYEEF